MPSEAWISGYCDGAVPVINGTGADAICSFLPECGLEGLVSVSGCYIGTFYYTDRLERPWYGSRSRIGFTGRDISDIGECARHHTID